MSPPSGFHTHVGQKEEAQSREEGRGIVKHPGVGPQIWISETEPHRICSVAQLCYSPSGCTGKGGGQGWGPPPAGWSQLSAREVRPHPAFLSQLLPRVANQKACESVRFFGFRS